MQDWNVTLWTPWGNRYPNLVEANWGTAFMGATLPDGDVVDVVADADGTSTPLSITLTTNHGNGWRKIEVYDIKAMRLENEGDDGPVLHRPAEIHLGDLVGGSESENGQNGAVINFDPANRVVVFHKAKWDGHHLMYVARATWLGLQTSRWYRLNWHD